MTIYKKLAQVQCELMKITIPKSGYNSYQHYNYYDLEDLLPVILKECMNHELFLHFTFTETEGILTIKSFDTEESIETRVPLPNIAENTKNLNNLTITQIKNDLIQAQGGYITYAKRYLLLNLFLISEKDHIEEFSGKEDEEEVKKEVKKPKNKTKRIEHKSTPKPLRMNKTGENKSSNIIKAEKELREHNTVCNSVTMKQAIKSLDLDSAIEEKELAYIKENY